MESVTNELILPFRFRIIQEGIYSGAYPTLRNYRYLKRLKLKTIISLTPEEPISDLKEFTKCEKISLFHYKASNYEETISLDNNKVNQIIQQCINIKNHPIYIHCLNGSNVTHQVIMSLRKLQHWSYNSIQNEFKRYCEEFSKDEQDFLYDWKGEIKIENQKFLPNWLSNELWWRGELVSHPTIQLNFLEQEKIIKKKKKLSNHLNIKLKLNYKEYPSYVETPNLISYSQLNDWDFNIQELDCLSIEKGHIHLKKSNNLIDFELPEQVLNYFENIPQNIEFE